MVILNRIYTRTGDGGQTSLADGSRVEKVDSRIITGGSIDELNSWLGMVSVSAQRQDLQSMIRRLQHLLFDMGADVSSPWDPAASDDRCPRINAAHVTWLENCIDELNQPLASLKSFVLPGGCPAAAALHLARSTCRRAELDVLRLNSEHKINPQLAVFVNRLSDLLFVMARSVNADGEGDVLWEPGVSSPS